MDTAEVSVDSEPLIDELRNDTTPTIYEGGATSWNHGLRGKLKTTWQTCPTSPPGGAGVSRGSGGGHVIWVATSERDRIGYFECWHLGLPSGNPIPFQLALGCAAGNGPVSGPLEPARSVWRDARLQRPFVPGVADQYCAAPRTSSPL